MLDRAKVAVAILGLVAMLASPKAAQACSVALVMGLDVSSSVDTHEYTLQVTGLADALESPAVANAILTTGGIWAAAFLWSGQERQDLMADWTWLADRKDIATFAKQIRAAPRTVGSWPTALGRAAVFAADQHRRAPEHCDRRVIDISGDGINNSGRAADWYRERGRFEGLIINGLVIRGAGPDPYNHYAKRLIHGQNAFVEIAEDYADYARAIKRKLVRELTPTGLAMGQP